MVLLHIGKKSVLTVTGIVDGQTPPQPTTPVGKPTYTVDVQGFISLFPSSDGMSCDVGFIKGGSPPILTVTCDIDGIKKTQQYSTAVAPVANFTMTQGPEVNV